MVVTAIDEGLFAVAAKICGIHRPVIKWRTRAEQSLEAKESW